uniref:Protein kinase domain-containing protein n=1 Tax=Nothobranchius furzeri TaxID=105023 RepID=A0A8C6P0L0_NOTFU
MRFIVDVLGQPQNELLEKGCQSRRFFKEVKQGSDYVWRLRTPKEFEKITGSEVKKTDCNNLTDLSDFLFKSNQPEPIDYDDTEDFIDLLRKMLNVDPALRIKPADALNHPFITMKHLRYISDEFYLTESQRIMKECQHREQENTYSSLSTPNSNREQTPDLDFSKEGKINPSHLVQTKTRTGTSGIETKAEKKNTPHSDPRKISPDDEEHNQLFSSDIFEGANSEDSKMDQSIKWETDSSDTDEGSFSTDSQFLDSGTFGEVARCHMVGQDKMVALKVMSGQYELEFLNEVQALQLLNKLTHFKHCFVKLNDSFTYRGFLFQEFEPLDQTLFDYMKKRDGTLKVAEVRAIAQQILVAFSALKQLGITHTNIKIDNIMLVNHEAHPFRVKLIDFGLAFENECLPQKGIYQDLPYRAPEITLGLPRDEAIDTWSLGCLLSVLFLDCYLFPYENEYDNLRIILKLLGQPDQKQLDEGTLVSDYFIKVKNGSECSWRFKTLKQYEKKSGKMLTVDPANRILPADALKHPFITMEHLDGCSDKRYVRNARKLMRNVQPGKFPSDGESVISERPGPSQVPEELLMDSLSSDLSTDWETSSSDTDETNS